jgi:putative membrane protein
MPMDLTMTLSQSLAGLPAFLLYFALGLVLLAAFFLLYTWVTPYNEVALIREGNAAAALSLSGALIGFVLPLASAIAHSVGIVDMIAWAVIAMVTQIVVYFVVGLAVPHFVEAIRAGRTSAATLLATFSLVAGLLNAAALTY